MKRRAGDNSAVARGISQQRPTPHSWEVLDSLPHAMRLALWQAPVAINPLSVRDLIEWEGVGHAVAMVEDAARQEIVAFSRDHQTRHGYPLPHLAAEVEPQPYAAPVARPSRARRRR